MIYLSHYQITGKEDLKHMPIFGEISIVDEVMRYDIKSNSTIGVLKKYYFLIPD